MTQPLFPGRDERVARVALPVPADDLFEYAVPAELEEQARPGCRVQVRFRDRPLTGVIVERSSERRFGGSLRPLEGVVDPEPVLSGPLLAVLREAASDLLCPLGIALATALPAGSAPRLSRGLALSPRGRTALATGAARGRPAELLAALEAGPRTLAELGRAGFPPEFVGELEAGRLVVRCGVVRAPRARAARERAVRLRPGVAVDAALRGELARAPRQAELLRQLAGGGAVATSELVRGRPGGAAALRALVRRGFVESFERAAPRDVLGAPLPGERAGALPALTPHQADAWKPIAEAIDRHRPETFLLQGVTGSGKTEIYLRAVAAALRDGRQALVLVPEITLTHQILARLRARFGDGLAVLHSGLRPGERLEQWQRLRRGATPIAVGARSAVFAPLEDLGVIVLDEEHDGAYKNEEGFRYHARDLARLRAAAARCPVLLGSATPSLETRFAADRGELRRLVLPERIGGRSLPMVEIVDLQRERNLQPRGRRPILSARLASAMRETLADGGQTILLLNRRGFSTQVLCFACGFAEHCERCDIALVYHAADQQLRCHYCDHRVPPPDACRGCGASELALLGLGTQRLEEEVRVQFPEARIARLDRDTAARRGHTRQVLQGLHRGQLDIVLGTQMVAKGHDFPGVRLVGVVLADLGLHLPDFRAAERTFQLLTQVAGRAGRDALPGRVIVQTYVPDHYAVRHAQRHDFESFYAEELGHRAALAYPPFGQLVHVLVSAPALEVALAAADQLARRVPRDPALERLGPAPAPLARLRDRYRVQLLVKSQQPAALRRAGLALSRALGELPDGVAASLDPRPVQML